MLQYKDELNYSLSTNYNIDQQLAELHELCKKKITDYRLYQQIRSFIYKQLKINELAVTKILNDLIELRKKKPKVALLIQFFISNNQLSYKEIAYEFNCSKQYVYQCLDYYSKEYIWLRNLIRIKGDSDSKNQCNRTVFFPQKKKKIEQLQLWGEEAFR